MAENGRNQVRDPRTYAIVAAAKEVHDALGSGFLEPVYQEALAVEFGRQGVPFARQVALPVVYRGQPLNASFCADFVCFGTVLVEVEVREAVSEREEAWVVNGLKAARLEVGVVLNFGGASLEHRRLVSEVVSAR